MQQKARMTFRFEPSKPPVRPQQPPKEPMTDSAPSAPSAPHRPRETPPSGSYDRYAGGPLQDDPYTLEEIIRRSEPVQRPLGRTEEPKAAAVAPTLAAPAPGPDLAGHSELWNPEQDPVLLSGNLHSKDGPPWWRVFASVGGAVATGALFGYLVLSLFTEQKPFSANNVSGTTAPAQVSPATETVAPQTQQPGPARQPGGDSASVSPVSAEIPDSNYYLLQYGVFRSEDSMNAALEELRSKGLPGAADRTDGYRVYAGVAGSREEAEKLAGQLSGLEVFIKTSASEAFRPEAGRASDAMAGFIEKSGKLSLALSKLSIAALEQEMPGAIDPADLVSLRETHRRWLDTTEAATAGLTAPAAETAKSLLQALNAAMVSVDDYGRNHSRFHLWGVQARVMDALLAERVLRTELH